MASGKTGFAKYHGLGNDYIVIDPADLGYEPTVEQIRIICHRNYGIGSDGILLGPLPSPSGGFSLRIFNPDGSEAEKSGNGLRIFSRYLWDRKLIDDAPFIISTLGGDVTATVFDSGTTVKVEMGKAVFDSGKIPVSGPEREVVDELLALDGEDPSLKFTAVSVGNPHCVIVRDNPDPDETRRMGPRIETDPRFPNRINVQFMKVIDPNNIRIEIWERGAGYTLASGSSSCAAAAAARRLGLCRSEINVRMPGGEIAVEFSGDDLITMTGPVTKVCEGVFFPEAFKGAGPL